MGGGDWRVGEGVQFKNGPSAVHCDANFLVIIIINNKPGSEDKIQNSATVNLRVVKGD